MASNKGPTPPPKWLPNADEYLGKPKSGAQALPAPPAAQAQDTATARPSRPDPAPLTASVDRATAGAWLHLALALPDDATPFPWQQRLLDRFLEGDLPRALDLPTGLGKTSVMAIWLVARALGAPVPRRLIYVVDRRAVIDQATEIAERLRSNTSEWTRSHPDVATHLGIGADSLLPVSTLRGQLADNRAWLADPSSSAIVLGTIDMIGSRLLFEGYGVSRRMRPYHAGFLGADALVVLDEAHLVSAFESLVRSVESDAALHPRHVLRTLVPKLSLMSSSATGRSADERTFRLSDADEAHPIVRRRLNARKCIMVRDAIDTTETSLPEVLAKEALALAVDGEPIRCIVFCNGRDDAQKTKAAIERLGAANKKTFAPDVELFVGGRRVYEREDAARWLRERGFLAGHVAKPSRPTFVISTSAGEVGVDLDADHTVTDVVAWERMVQRLGRVNRRGDGDAKVIVVPALPPKKTRDALEKKPDARKPEDEQLIRSARLLDASLACINALPSIAGGLDGSPSALVALKERARTDDALAGLLRTATSPDPLRPALTRPLLEAWSMTSLEEHAGRPEVQPWIRGWIDDEPQTTIVWRRSLPVTTGKIALPDKQLELFFEAASPHTLEQLETETWRALDWLAKRLDALDNKPTVARTPTEPPPSDTTEEPETADNERAEEVTAAPNEPPSVDGDQPLKQRDLVAFVLAANKKPYAVGGYLPSDPKQRKRTLDRLEVDLRGGRLIVDARLGGIEAGLLTDEHRSPAVDVSTLGAGVPFRVVETTSLSPSDPGFREELRFAIHTTPEGTADRWLAIERPHAETAITEEGRSISRAQLLDQHEACAEKWARAIAGRLTLPAEYTEMLAHAARLHDEGKKAKRWQSAFHAPPDGVYGKTRSRPNIALLDGYRHEFGSLPYAAADAGVAALPQQLRDLCLHLIAAHHGHARPVVPTRSCEDAPPSALEERAREVAMRFARLELEWGPWGLAWWESLLRAADQQASRENDEADMGAGAKEVVGG